MSQFSQHSHTLAAVTNGTDGTYYYYLSMSEFPYLGLQFILSGGSGTATVTIEGSCEPTTVATSCTYADMTLSLTGVASFTASRLTLIDTPMPIRWLRVKVVAATGGANDADWTVHAVQVKG